MAFYAQTDLRILPKQTKEDQTVNTLTCAVFSVSMCISEAIWAGFFWPFCRCPHCPVNEG